MPKAQLATAQANQVKAQLDVDRYTPLAKEQAIPQQDLDNAVQANEAAKAQVQAAKAQIEAAKAQVAISAARPGVYQSRLAHRRHRRQSLRHRLAISSVKATLLTTVSTLDPIKVYFPVSEREYLDYGKENPDATERAA